MKIRDELTDDEKYFLDVYEEGPIKPSYAFRRGKEIYESLKPEQWEPKRGGFIIINGCVANKLYNTDFREFGNEYQTREEAEMVRDMQKELNILNQRILEYNRENGVGLDDANYCIMYDNVDKKWLYGWECRSQRPGFFYTDEEGADTIVKELNAGLIKGIER